MEKSKKLILILCCVVIGYVMLFFFITVLDDPYGPGPIDKMPKGSKRGILSVYNSGCCFVIKDFKIEARFENGERQLLMEWENLSFTALQTETLNVNDLGSFTIYVFFYYEYIDRGTTEFPIMRLENSDDINNKGLYLLISDAVIRLKMGNYETGFSYDDSPWKDSFVPVTNEKE